MRTVAVVTISLRASAVAAAVCILGITVASPTTFAGGLQSTHAPKTEPLTIGKPQATLDDPGRMSNDSFGNAEAQSGNTLIVGARGTSNDDGDTGAAYIYIKGPSGWPKTPSVTLASPDGCGLCYFGDAVAISGDTAIVGAYGAGHNMYVGKAYIYVKGPSGWPSTPTVKLKNPNPSVDDDFFGYSVAVSANTALIGEFGWAYLYTRTGAGWSSKPTTTLADPSASSGGEFGYSVSLSGDTAVVGAPDTTVTKVGNAGKAYIYVRGSSGWPSTPTKTLVDPDDMQYDQFGFSVSISTKTLLVGAVGPNKNAGAVYIYARGTSGWSGKPITTLSDPAATSYDQFGATLALSGIVAVIGETGVDTNVGRAYIFKEGPSGWPESPTITLTDPEGMPSDDFGAAVGASGNDGVIGAPENGYTGVAYIYQVRSS